MDFIISPRELRAVFAVTEELHFGRAAERLGMAQPQLSQMIRRVERLAGFAIFTRRPQVSLTGAGAVLVAAARRAGRELEDGIAEGRAVASGKKGNVRIGFSDVAMLTPLPATLRGFATANPDVDLKLREGHSQHLLEQMRRGEFDIIVTRQQVDEPGFHSIKAIADHMMLALPVGHRLAGRECVRLGELESESFLIFRRSTAPAYYDRIISACAAAGFSPRITQEVDTLSATMALVAAGFGISFASTASKARGHAGVRLCHIEDEMPDVSLWLTCRPDRLTPASRIAIDAILCSGT